MVNVPSASLTPRSGYRRPGPARRRSAPCSPVEHLALDRARGRHGRGGLHAHGDRDRRLVGTDDRRVGGWFGASDVERDIVDRDAGQREAAVAGGDGLDLGAVHAHGRAGERCVVASETTPPIMRVAGGGGGAVLTITTLSCSAVVAPSTELACW